MKLQRKRLLSEHDVKTILGCLQEGGGTPPDHLKFQIIQAKASRKLSPPDLNFSEGLYVLLQSRDGSTFTASSMKRRKLDDNDHDNNHNNEEDNNIDDGYNPGMVDLLPSAAHLKHLVPQKLPPPLPDGYFYSISGPQCSRPTPIQLRYCYGPRALSGENSHRSMINMERYQVMDKTGSVWTMYDKNGREDLRFRLFQVEYFPCFHSLWTDYSKTYPTETALLLRGEEPSSEMRDRIQWEGFWKLVEKQVVKYCRNCTEETANLLANKPDEALRDYVLHVLALNGAPLELLQLAVLKGSFPANVQDVHRKLPLHYVLAKDRSDCFYVYDDIDQVKTRKKVKLLLEAYPESVKQPDSNGDLPLHVALHGHVYWRGGLDLMFQAFPEAAGQRDSNGDFPLHLMLASGDCDFEEYISWNREGKKGLKQLLEAYPAALDHCSTTTGLLPFQLAAANGSSVGTIFTLLIQRPRFGH